VVILAPCLFLVLAGTGPFEGCGGAHEEPRPLPVDSASACFFDTDCEPIACEALRCIGGVCTEIAPLRDGDGDGFALSPCGERFDCDDTDPAIHPDARELCDLVDQDCDAAIDEGADPRAIRFDLSTIDPAMTMVAWGDHLLVTDAAFSMRRVNVRHVSLDGTISVTETLLETTSRGFAADASATTDGALFAIAIEDPATDAQEIVLIHARRGVDDVVEVVGEPVRLAVEELEDIALTVIGDVPVIAWDAGSTRFLWSPGWAGEPREIASGLVEGLASLDLASDGASAVIATGRGVLSFFDPADR
jgi:hypothetical protein